MLGAKWHENSCALLRRRRRLRVCASTTPIRFNSISSLALWSTPKLLIKFNRIACASARTVPFYIYARILEQIFRNLIHPLLSTPFYSVLACFMYMCVRVHSGKFTARETQKRMCVCTYTQCIRRCKVNLNFSPNRLCVRGRTRVDEATTFVLLGELHSAARRENLLFHSLSLSHDGFYN